MGCVSNWVLLFCSHWSLNLLWEHKSERARSNSAAASPTQVDPGDVLRKWSSWALLYSMQWFLQIGEVCFNYCFHHEDRKKKKKKQVQCWKESGALLFTNTFYLQFQSAFMYSQAFLFFTYAGIIFPFIFFLSLKVCQNCAFLFPCLKFHVLCGATLYFCYVNYGQLNNVLNYVYTDYKIYITTQLTKFSLNMHFKYLLVN